MTVAKTVVVGGGPAGLYAAEKWASLGPVLVLEASDLPGGRARNALHLVDSETAPLYPVLTGAPLGPMRVRWEREWRDATDVDWASKEWAAVLSQWKLPRGGARSLCLSTQSSVSDNVKVVLRAPVSSLQMGTSGEDAGLWILETPGKTYKAERVVWAAGLKPFQNAYGKHEAQDFLVGNPLYDQDSADWRGGVGLELEFTKLPEAAEAGFDPESVFALPVRFNGKFHLMIGTVLADSESVLVKTLTHVHDELLADPKTMMSFQKTLRRALKGLLGEGDDSKPKERWVVSDRVLGHVFGAAWVFARRGDMDSLLFVGDETLAAVESREFDTLGALASVGA
jgi:hypothetical protein